MAATICDAPADVDSQTAFRRTSTGARNPLTEPAAPNSRQYNALTLAKAPRKSGDPSAADQGNTDVIQLSNHAPMDW